MSAVRGEGVEDIVSLYGAGGMGQYSSQIMEVTNASDHIIWQHLFFSLQSC